ncbi:MAG: sulfotransferase family 2 domain-containing protein [Pseudomonadota bacterium]
MNYFRAGARRLVGRIPEKQPLATKLNEAVNFPKKTIFIAVPKTGTTSIRDQLNEPGFSLIPEYHLTIRQVRDSLYTFLLTQELNSNHSFPTDPALVKSDDEIREEAAEVFRTFFKFASVRNPWARTVSLYKRREGVKMAKDMDFDTFCAQLRYSSDTCRHPTRMPNQLDWMTDENGELLVDYVLKLEDHDKGVQEINELTNGRLELQSRRLNSNPNSSSETYRDLYSPEARDHVAKAFQRDIEYFGYEF